MRVLLVGETTRPLTRLKQVLGQRGWVVDGQAVIAAESAPCGPYDAVVIERGEPGQVLGPTIAMLRQVVEASLFLVLGDFLPGERAEILALDVDDVIQRDAQSDLLVRRLTALLRLRSASFCDVYQLDDLVIDINRRRVRRSNREILLSQREFQLLLVLAREAGAVLSRSAIIERLWADDLTVGDNAVDAVASRLRRRLDGPFGHKLLHTVRGVGYCLMGAPADQEYRLVS